MDDAVGLLPGCRMAERVEVTVWRCVAQPSRCSRVVCRDPGRYDDRGPASAAMGKQPFRMFHHSYNLLLRYLIARYILSWAAGSSPLVDCPGMYVLGGYF